MQMKHDTVASLEGMRKQNPNLKLWIISAAVILVIAVAVAGFLVLNSRSKKPIDTAVLTVAVAPAHMAMIQRKLPVTGTIWAWDPLAIGAEVGGLKIDSILVDEGHTVQKGQVLATLNSSVLRAALEREQARVKRASANYEKSKQPNRPQDIAGLKAALAAAQAQIAQEEANVVRAKANLELAKSNAERYAFLAKDGAVSDQEVESRHTAAKTAQADLSNSEKRLEAARFVARQATERLTMAQEGGRTEDIMIAEAEAKEALANLHHIEAQIRQTVIVAPDDGLITKRHGHIGDVTVATQPLFEMVRDSRFEVRASVPEHDLSRIAPGISVTFQGAGLRNSFVGALREVSPMVDRNTRLATARIDIPFSKELRPGMFVHGQATVGAESVLCVPAQAVLDRDGRSLVFVYEDGKVTSRAVTVGERSGDLIELKSGLNPSEKVVIAGAGFLKDGDKVRVSDLPSSSGNP